MSTNGKWITGALLVGVAIAFFLGADQRQFLFYIIFVVGCVVVVRLNRGSAPGTSLTRPPEETHDLLQELVVGETRTGEAAREWLDSLLVQQQEEEQK